MAEADLRDLANFVSRGQVNMDRYVDRKTRVAKGHETLRQDYYKSICIGCHGRDGHRLRTIPPLGDVARDNPWESLHKILNGHPSERMPALRVLDRQTLVDVLAYVQTLPDGEIVSSIVRGGRLYDSWRKEIAGVQYIDSLPDHPANKKHPAYPIGGALAKEPRANWRCKECHGWDYRGRDGAYGTGRHFTGIKGIRDMAGADEVLSYQEFRDLANFVSKGQVEMDRYIDRASRLAKGDKTRHATYYTTICAICHGDEGMTIITGLPLGQIARHDPWETLHKIINGHPDEPMPALRVVGMEILTDILAYVQSLPPER
jgi:mono/diheme cytochrome c family protein